MGIYGIKPRFQRLLEPLVRWLVSERISPDLITFSGFGMSLLAALCLLAAQSNPSLLLVVLPAAMIRLTLNALDGQVARRTGKAGPWGEVKNELTDRLGDASIFIAIGFGGYADARLALLALAVVLLIPFVGVLGKAVGYERVYGGFMGKPDRMVALVIISLYAWWSGNLTSFNLLLGVVAVIGVLTMALRLRKVYDHIQSSH